MKVDKQGDVRGQGHPTRDAIEWMVPILWVAKVLTLPGRGPYPAFKGEARIALRLMEDIEVPFSVSRSNVPMPPWATPSVYHSYDYSGFLRRSVIDGEEFSVQPTADTHRDHPLLSSTTAQLTIIALKGGTALMAQEYWIEGGQMHCIFNTGEGRLLPLEKLTSIKRYG